MLVYYSSYDSLQYDLQLFYQLHTVVILYVADHIMDTQKTRIVGFQALLDQTAQDVTQLQATLASLDDIQARASQLLAYYHGTWIEDHTAAGEGSLDEHYEILTQDSLWNTLQDLYDTKVKILQHIARDL